jgi:uncharacterized PurR-regulated membrane protein YhhQ (DUF165 family)
VVPLGTGCTSIGDGTAHYFLALKIIMRIWNASVVKNTVKTVFTALLTAALLHYITFLAIPDGKDAS